MVKMACGAYYTAGGAGAVPGSRARCRLLVLVEDVLLGRLASSPPADCKSALHLGGAPSLA